MKKKVKRIIEHSDFEKEYYSYNAYDSELTYWEYTIPEGFKAEIKDNKVIIKKI